MSKHHLRVVEEDKVDKKADSAEEAYSEEETERRRDAALKRALGTSPRQHQEDVGKRPKPKPKSIKRNPA